ncbi:MAG: tail fiber domain-containing protein, partial [Bacteroidota bacterium]
IPNPAQGLLVFISSDTSFHYYTGTQWESLSAPILQVTGGVAYTAGLGIEINGDQIINLGDADPNDDVQINSSAEGDLGGVFPDPLVVGIQGRPIENTEPTDGQVLKWDGVAWTPANDNAGDASYEAGEGIEIEGTQIRNLGDLDPTDDLLIGTQAEGDLSGNLPQAQVTGIQGRPVENAEPTDGQVLKWNGTEWAPANDNAGDASYEAGEGIQIENTTITNLAPDIPISLSGQGATEITGTYPDFVVSSTDSVNDADSDPTNEMQSLIVEGDTLELTGGNRITLPKSSLWEQKENHIYYNAGNVGIHVDTPLTSLHLGSDQTVLWGDSLSGSGFKMIWYGAKGAMRMGYLNQPFGGYNYDNFWDYDSVGFYSFAGGQNSRAKGFGSFAFGSFGWADGSSSVAFFGNAQGNGSFSFGGSSKGRGSITFEGVAEEEGGIAMYGYTGGRYGVSIGGGTTGLGASSSREDYAVAIGWNSDARGLASVALGPSDAYGYTSFSTGWVTEARGNYSSTFGHRSIAKSYASTALGRLNLDEGDSANWRATDPILTIGGGTESFSGNVRVENRRNIFSILKNGQTAIGYDFATGMLQVSSALGSLNNNGTLDPTNAALLLGTSTSGMAFDANQIESISDELYLNFNSNQHIRLGEGGGNVGIGLPPSTRLDIKQSQDNANGGIRLRSSASDNTFWDAYYDGTSNDLSFAFQGNTVATIDAGTGAFTQLSDLRVKKHIRPLESSLEKLLRLRPVSYHYLQQEAGDKPSLGFIAQEVEPLFPELVETSGKWKALSYPSFSVLAIKGLQELTQDYSKFKSEVLSSQAEKIQHLEAQVYALQQQLEALMQVLPTPSQP